MKKEYVTIALAYVGIIVGAGLSSGQDILQYFLSFGKIGILGGHSARSSERYFWKNNAYLWKLLPVQQP